MECAQATSQSISEAIKPDVIFTVTEWADTKRKLPRVSAKEHGQYSSDRTPYWKEVMDCLSPDDPTQEISLMTATQMGKSEVGNNWIFSSIDLHPVPFLVLLPSSDLASAHVKQKFDPALKAMPDLHNKIKRYKPRDQSDTLYVKEYPGGILFFSGSNSPVAYRQKTICYIFADDIDGFILEVGDEGDPLDLIRNRTDSFGVRKKILWSSTPTLKNISRIERVFNESDRRYFNVPCPHCGHFQPLEWGGKDVEYGIKWKLDRFGKLSNIRYVCKQCHGDIPEYQKTEMLREGSWVATYPERQKRGYHLSALYSPVGFVSWKQIVQEFLEAQGNPIKLKVWTNTRMARTWEEKGEQPSWTSLKVRAESYDMMTVPENGLILTSGVDVKEDRLSVVVRAWGPEEESWLIYYGELYGQPSENIVWNQLDSILSRGYIHACGMPLYILTMAIDSGYATQAVYNYCRNRAPKTIAIKGSSSSGIPIISAPRWQELNYKGERIKKGVQLWMIGTDTAKSTIYSRLGIEEPGPGYYHFPIGVEDEYYLQLTAEKHYTKMVKGYPRKVWTLIGPRNHYLDCEGYALAAAIRSGVAVLNWEKIRESLKPQEDKPVPEEPKTKKGGWLPDKKGWLNR